jgi:hypothetical protein
MPRYSGELHYCAQRTNDELHLTSHFLVAWRSSHLIEILLLISCRPFPSIAQTTVQLHFVAYPCTTIIKVSMHKLMCHTLSGWIRQEGRQNNDSERQDTPEAPTKTITAKTGAQVSVHSFQQRNQRSASPLNPSPLCRGYPDRIDANSSRPSHSQRLTLRRNRLQAYDSLNTTAKLIGTQIATYDEHEGKFGFGKDAPKMTKDKSHAQEV